MDLAKVGERDLLTCKLATVLEGQVGTRRTSGVWGMEYGIWNMGCRPAAPQCLSACGRAGVRDVGAGGLTVKSMILLYLVSTAS